MSKINYVLLHVFDPNLNMVCLEKKTGPKILIDKITVPGGKVEPNESIYQAASRELKEETFLDAKPTDFVLYETLEFPDCCIFKLFALNIDFSQLKQLTHEPVYSSHFETVHKDYWANPQKYTYDFHVNLIKVLNTIL